MKDRALFVFAGQSNMCGFASLPAKEQVFFKDSFEYLHKAKRLGYKHGTFKNTGLPAGEFVYKDLAQAYGDNIDVNEKSSLADSDKNCYFTSSLCNAKRDGTKDCVSFGSLSEKDTALAVSPAPYIALEWEKKCGPCAYTHIAKSAVSIRHFFDNDMIKQVNAQIKDSKEQSEVDDMCLGASEYFFTKCKDFFEDSKEKFNGDNMPVKALVWLQGESDCEMSQEEYFTYLKVFWEKCKQIGFTHFFIIRVSYWWRDYIKGVIKAQEEFCAKTEGAYIVTRLNSFIPLTNQDIKSWFIKKPKVNLYGCRDSDFGYYDNLKNKDLNYHLNENGCKLVAKATVKNMKRVLCKGKTPKLEKENLRIF